MRRRRGSAILYVVIMIAALTTVLVASTSITSNSLATQIRREREAQSRASADGIAAKVVEDWLAGNLNIPASRSITLGRSGSSYTVVDNGSTLARSLRLDVTTHVGGQTMTESRVVGARVDPSPFWYAVFANSDTSLTTTLVTGSNQMNGDVAINGNVTLSGAGTEVNGDLEASGLVSAAGAEVKGTAYSGVTPVTVPVPVRANYLLAATSNVSLSSLTSLNLTAVAGAYPVLYRSGSLDLSGTVNGSGLVYVAGNLRITGPLTYGSSSSRVVFIAEGSIEIRASATNIVGYYYTPNTFFCTGSGPRTLTKGAIVCRQFQPGVNFTAYHDPLVWYDAKEAVKLKIPGFWP